jgi:hypothetical protein
MDTVTAAFAAAFRNDQAVRKRLRASGAAETIPPTWVNVFQKAKNAHLLWSTAIININTSWPTSAAPSAFPASQFGNLQAAISKPPDPSVHTKEKNNRVAQTAFILFSTFLDIRPVSDASDWQTSIYGGLEIRISNSKTPAWAPLIGRYPVPEFLPQALNGIL